MPRELDPNDVNYNSSYITDPPLSATGQETPNIPASGGGLDYTNKDRVYFTFATVAEKLRIDKQVLVTELNNKGIRVSSDSNTYVKLQNTSSDNGAVPTTLVAKRGTVHFDFREDSDSDQTPAGVFNVYGLTVSENGAGLNTGDVYRTSSGVLKIK